MRVPSSKLSRTYRIICPFCESGELVSVGPGFARCGSCGLPLLGSTLETLRDIVGLPDALGTHPCECGHPEMRELPGGVFHCPTCRSEVMPIGTQAIDTRRRGRPMVGYMSLEEQVDKDFSRACRRALLRRIGARLRGRDTASGGLLLCSDQLSKIPGAMGRIYRGMRTVPIAQIGGSVGRCSEFDGDFMPAKASVGQRWKSIDRAFHRGEELPPVSLYKVGGFYFVLDGHHRVSVAHYHGVEWIDAYVTEFGASGGSWSERRDREKTA